MATRHSASVSISVTKRLMSQTGSNPKWPVMSLNSAANARTFQHQHSIGMHTDKPVTSYRLQICHTIPYTVIGLTEALDSSQESQKSQVQHSQSSKKRSPLTPSALNPQGPQEDAICWETACLHSSFDRICRAGVHSCFLPRDHNRLHTGIY